MNDIYTSIGFEFHPPRPHRGGPPIKQVLSLRLFLLRIWVKVICKLCVWQMKLDSHRRALRGDHFGDATDMMREKGGA